MKLSSTIIWRVFDHLCNAQWAYTVFNFMKLYPETLHEYAMNKYVYCDDKEKIWNIRQTLEYALDKIGKIKTYYVKGDHSSEYSYRRYEDSDSEVDESDWLTQEESKQIINDINNQTFLIKIHRPQNSWLNRNGEGAKYSDSRAYFNGKMIYYESYSKGWDNGCPQSDFCKSQYDGHGKLIYKYKY